MSIERDNANGIFLAIGGPSGAGKSTAIKAIKSHFGSRVYESVTYTTRQPRKGEVDGKHYHFVEISKMPDYQKNPRYANFVSARGNWYWVDSVELISASCKNVGGIYLAAITQVHEFTEMKRVFPAIHWIWLTAKSSELCSRLEDRGDEDINKSKAHNELLEKQDRCKLINLEIDTSENDFETTLKLIIHFIEKLTEEKP